MMAKKNVAWDKISPQKAPMSLLDYPSNLALVSKRNCIFATDRQNVCFIPLFKRNSSFMLTYLHSDYKTIVLWTEETF